MAFMLMQTESRRNVLAQWGEQIVWCRSAEQFPVVDDEPIPFVGREEGFIDRKVMDILEEHEVPYTIVFNAGDLTAITAAVEAGIGVMVAPLRAVLQGRIRRQTPSGACRSFHFSRRSAERHGQKAGAASGKGNRRHRCLCAE
ncbi:MAG: LysR substrate-binding domain-containing protein [Xanthobacteraceae bacterium]